MATTHELRDVGRFLEKGISAEQVARRGRRAIQGRAMFQVSVEETFSAGHALRGYRGKCENLHGHNYRVRVTLEGPQLDSIGLLCDFTQLKQVHARNHRRCWITSS